MTVTPPVTGSATFTRPRLFTPGPVEIPVRILRALSQVPPHHRTDVFRETYKRVSEEPPQDRITTSSWFERKHREVAPQVWKRAAIGSRANCAACHTGADKGDFDDDNIRIPK